MNSGYSRKLVGARANDLIHLSPKRYIIYPEDRSNAQAYPFDKGSVITVGSPQNGGCLHWRNYGPRYK